MEPTPNQVGWVPTVGELYYGLNPSPSIILRSHS